MSSGQMVGTFCPKVMLLSTNDTEHLMLNSAIKFQRPRQGKLVSGLNVGQTLRLIFKGKEIDCQNRISFTNKSDLGVCLNGKGERNRERQRENVLYNEKQYSYPHKKELHSVGRMSIRLNPAELHSLHFFNQ